MIGEEATRIINMAGWQVPGVIEHHGTLEDYNQFSVMDVEVPLLSDDGIRGT
jgi:hypothetical protein